MRHQPPPSALPDIVDRVRAITARALIDMPTTPLSHSDGRGGQVLTERTIPKRADEIADRAAQAIGRAFVPYVGVETLRSDEVAARLPGLDAALAELDVLNTVLRPRLEEIRSMTSALVEDLTAAETARAAGEAEAHREAALDARAQAIAAQREAERIQAIKDEARAELAGAGKGQ